MAFGVYVAIRNSGDAYARCYVFAGVLLSASVSGVKSVVGTVPHWFLQ